jgi:DNA repair exonuclease SbcCD nuclease subunit
MLNEYALISDLHLGLSRTAGITDSSLRQFEDDKLNFLHTFLSENEDKEIIIAGDLFDGNLIPLSVLLSALRALHGHANRIWILAGNHDLSKNTDIFSSFEFLRSMIDFWPGSNITMVTEPLVIEKHNLVMIPHLSNQEIFDKALGDYSNKDHTLITHCNYDNFFALNKDHALNLTQEQAQKFKQVVSGHEHAIRSVGNVHMIGSFAPCNVKEAATPKRTYILDAKTGKLEAVQNLEQDNICAYSELHYNDLQKPMPGRAAGFIKIIGSVTAAEAPLILTQIADFRKRSAAYMIQNATVVEAVGLESFEETSFESVDTWKALGSMLKPEHKIQLRELGYAID